MYLARALTRSSLLPLYNLGPRSAFKMSTTSAVYSSASLEAANAQPFSTMDGKLDPKLLEALKEMNFEFMTPVQSKVLQGLPSMKSDWYVIFLRPGPSRTVHCK